jgi:hypothetical protein
MPVHVDWDNDEKTIIYALYEGQWTWEEFYGAIRQCQEMNATVPHPVHIIAHLRGNFLPRGAWVSHSENAIKRSNSSMGFIVIVTESQFLQSLMRVSSTVSPKWRETYRVARTVEEARTLIAQETSAKRF